MKKQTVLQSQAQDEGHQVWSMGHHGLSCGLCTFVGTPGDRSAPPPISKVPKTFALRFSGPYCLSNPR